MSATVWRYLDGREVKHAFFSAPGTFTSARCGLGPRWFDPRGWRGGTPEDAARLDQLQPCKRCVASVGDGS